MSKPLPTRNEPPYTTTQVGLSNVTVKVSVCVWCGAMVAESTKPNHARWHESISKTTTQAREASFWGTPIG
jgi:hypothetical protein